MSSAFLTKGIVEKAMHVITPGVQEQYIEQVKGRMVAWIVVVDPTIQYAEERDMPILWEGYIGEGIRSRWPENRDYQRFARAKAALSWRTGFPSHVVIRDHPELLQKGDFKFGGSVVHNGIVVGTSGLDWQHDLAVSGMIAVNCHALCIRAGEEALTKKALFIGDPEPEEQPKS